MVVDGVVMNALFSGEAKRFPLLSQPCRAACLVGGHQGALDGPDADLVEVQPVAVARFQGVDEQVIQRDLLQLPVDVLFGLLGHVLLLGVSLMVMT